MYWWDAGPWCVEDGEEVGWRLWGWLLLYCDAHNHQTRPTRGHYISQLELPSLSFSVTTWWDKNKNKEPVGSRWSRVCASPSVWPASASWSAPSPWPPSSTHTSWTGSTARSYRGSPRYRFFVLFVTNKINAQKSWKFSVMLWKSLNLYLTICIRENDAQI